MKKSFILGAILLLTQSVVWAQNGGWEPAKGKIMTEWAEEIDPEKVHQEYPRPQMVREDNWQNLNGLWKFKIQAKGNANPSDYDGEILVPFAVESALSGVGKRVGKGNELWYRTSFDVKTSRRERVVLHFGAVDWEAEVFINGESVGIHKGGYTPFSFDITDKLKGRRNNELVVRVWDPTDEGPQPRGKQVNNPNGIWYTPVTGIWQTVWTETVPESHIVATKNTPNVDAETLTVETEVANSQSNQKVKVKALAEGKVVAEKEVGVGEPAVLNIKNPQLWGPGNPFLYDLEVSLVRGNRKIDEIESYAAMRKVSMEKDENGVLRMLLNDEFVFQYGPLDQGWWPDGLYTAPSEEALVFDIIKTQEMGFNMIRKHVKVEPARWYYHCDKMGMLVWQDMPNGDHGNQWNPRPGIIGVGTERDRSPESEAIYKKEWKEIIDANYNFPSIVVWVPFNEAWGQFKTVENVNWTVNYDPTRLVNGASGGNFHPAGQIMDLHNYPDPAMPDPKLFGDKMVLTLGEFGGLGLPVEGHTWQDKNNWGYQSFQTVEDLQNRYAQMMEKIAELIPKGLSAAVYTQTTDVEVETNGLMTYDRKVIKLTPEFLKKVHEKLYQAK
ncbi:glycoside hydrolase family 2 TIM barrel-domain containing protein [Echinicola jeungdonensis]|uniref:Glycoside hydrolase family 2 protein n=1 Tax=Echinicola jeungdonensis TaxID=709343 RepID=A0ABV5J9N5_9BACT|nr:sugar-binding domain-containing protein [Echinicola jeungdonensis]MDN3670511.1 glycoside hydrolase family 2 TIM barrel-domain containing protein [Echinicola jeungdonensis]